ncbi:acyltransferase family protein [Agrobacterium rosae]|uniref:Acyltransferase n=4 Tax=Agrobacterium rosae TaxID=1972867 RepID=A0AAE5VMT0_9HYPH|nr:acyltransferase [Agrobacterium rosae]KAA3508897.1 acyltransferase [Agrobacterium rosae]KAA3513472.1 acyltransferase [Agrobacterium rosae]MCM2435483.1 acyltransferase [Agrobacterium rosae]MDX8332277.1 acyltransferase [Agrobacterium rosae]MQB51028.1 acyltransferase [Agrobacterium rosae]
MTDTHVPHRFVLLDGIRGLAAVAIVHRHAEVFFGRPEASSYLAVDLFFALSGFVLAHAYGERLANGQIKPLNFMKARFLRLYPLYGLALLLMTAFFVCLYFLDLPTPIDDLHRKIQPAELGFALVTGMLFLPAPFTLTLNGALFLVSPAWSLFNELAVNIAYALKGARAQVKTIGVILALSACVLIIATIHSGKLHLGFRWHEMYAGMGRVFFSFFAGVLIYRFRSQTIKTRPALAVMCLSAVALVLFLPLTDEIRPIFDVVIVLLVWPILLNVSSSIEAGGWLDRVSSFLGTASYAVYVLHIPLLAWAVFLVPRAGDAGVALLAGLTFIVATVFISYALTVYFDQPLQIHMKKRLKASSVSKVLQAPRI